MIPAVADVVVTDDVDTRVGFMTLNVTVRERPAASLAWVPFDGFRLAFLDDSGRVFDHMLTASRTASFGFQNEAIAPGASVQITGLLNGLPFGAPVTLSNLDRGTDAVVEPCVC
jgi:hypothetical protein